VLVLEMCRWWLAHDIQPVIVTLSATPTDLSAEFQDLGVSVVCIDLPNSGYGRYVKMITDFYRLCRQFKPDAVLSMFLGWHTFMAYGCHLAGVHQVAAHVGNFPPYWTGTAFHKFRWQIQLGRPVTSKLICCSNYVREGVIQHFSLTDSETVTIYNGCPVESFTNLSNSAIYERQEHSIKIGMVARLELTKDHPTLIQAAQLLKEQGVSFQVQLIGEGSCRIEYETLIRNLQLEDCVQLLGMRRDIPELLNQMDVFVFSVKPGEGLGVAMIEAMAAEVPVVATDVRACREVLDQGELGVLVPPKDPQHMADAISQIINHPEEARHRAIKAKGKVFAKFTIENMAKEYAICLGLLK